MGVSTDAILFYGFCWAEEDMANPWEIGREDTDTDEDAAPDEDADASGGARVACTSATARDAVRATVNEPESQEQ